MADDWYIVYDLDGEQDVMTVSGEYAETEEQARKELTYSLPDAKFVMITQDPFALPEGLEAIDLDDAEDMLDDPNTVTVQDPNKLN